MLLRQTTYVTDIRFVGGIIVIVLPSYVVGPIVIIDINFGPWPNWFLSQILLNWNFVWNNLVVVNVNVSPARPSRSQPAPQPINNPQPMPPPSRPQGKPEGGGSADHRGESDLPRRDRVQQRRLPRCPIRAASERCASATSALPLRPDPKPQVCPVGMVFNDGACRQIDPASGSRKPPIVVDNDPCAKLSGAEFRRCITGTPNIPVDPKPPIKGPVTGDGDGRPIASRSVTWAMVRPATVRPADPIGGTVGIGESRQAERDRPPAVRCVRISSVTTDRRASCRRHR